MNPHRREINALVQRYLAGECSPEESALLEKSLETDPQLRTDYLDYLNLEVALEEIASTPRPAAQPTAADITPLPISKPSWFRWRPLASMAAGLVAGLLSAPSVFGYVAPLLFKPIQLVTESFESLRATKSIGVPDAPNVWTSDYGEVTAEALGVKPLRGSKMFRFLKANNELHPKPSSSVGEIYRLIDVRPHQAAIADGKALLQVSAYFNTFEVPDNELYNTGVSAFAFRAGSTPNSEYIRNIVALRSPSNMTRQILTGMDRNPATWQKLGCELNLPADTEFVLVQFMVSPGQNTPRRLDFAGHFIDEIRVSLNRRPPLW
jgi:hypothetical protein